MLHLLSKLPSDESGWANIASMMAIGDSVLVYQESIEALAKPHNLKSINDISRLGIKTYLCAEGFEGKLGEMRIPKTLIQVTWDHVVEMVENSSGVNSL